ncbi:DUF6660 family protein [Spirosoma knui]
MKLIHLLLSLYVVMLSALPCEALCWDGENVSQTSVPNTDDCSDTEWCSPFCLCATCPGFAVPAPLEFSKAQTAVCSLSNEQPTFYQPALRLIIVSRIWQPPRKG